jgi:hypothetical protein
MRPILFGLGLKEMLADEITTDLRAIHAQAVAQAAPAGVPVTRALTSKGISHGGAISIEEFVVDALKAQMGLSMADDPDLVAAQSRPVTTPSGMRLNGLTDVIERPPLKEGDIGTVERHGEAQDARDAFGAEPRCGVGVPGSLVIFPPDDTASDLEPGAPDAPDFPQFRRGSIRLRALVNSPSIVESQAHTTGGHKS